MELNITRLIVLCILQDNNACLSYSVILINAESPNPKAEPLGECLRTSILTMRHPANYRPIYRLAAIITLFDGGV